MMGWLAGGACLNSWLSSSSSVSAGGGGRGGGCSPAGGGGRGGAASDQHTHTAVTHGGHRLRYRYTGDHNTQSSAGIAAEAVSCWTRVNGSRRRESRLYSWRRNKHIALFGRRFDSV